MAVSGLAALLRRSCLTSFARISGRSLPETIFRENFDIPRQNLLHGGVRYDIIARGLRER